MSWHFSRALVEAYWEECSSDGEQFAPLKSNPTPSAYLSSDRMTAFSRLSLSSMTFASLTDDRGAELLTWYLAGFPAKTFQPQGKAQGSPEKEADSGKSSPGSLAKYDPDSRSWKTHQYSLLGGLTLFLETWPRWGIMLDGALYPQPTPALRISGKESGFLPTMLWPSPRVAQCATEGPNGSGGGLYLWGAIILAEHGEWPQPYTTATPRARELAKMWGTPKAQDSRAANTDRGKCNLGEQVHGAENVTENGGQLNPTWVEWLMGWPLGWTDLKPLVMANVLKLWLLHGTYSAKD